MPTPKKQHQGRASRGNAGKDTTGIPDRMDSFADVKRALSAWLARNEDKETHKDQWWKKRGQQ